MFRGLKKAFILSTLLLLLLAACSSKETSKDDQSAKSDLLEVSIDHARYVWTEGDGDYDKDVKEGTLEVTLSIKNISKSAVMVSPHDGIFLYDGDEQLNPVDAFGYDVGIEGNSSGDVNPGKSTKMKFYFPVERGKEYKLAIKPFTKNLEEEPDEIVLTLDTQKYDKSFEKMEEPLMALSAIIDTVFLGKENENYESLVGMEKEDILKDAKDAFEDKVNPKRYGNKIDADIDELQQQYISVLEEKADYKVNLKEFGGNKALVSIDYETVPLNNLYSEIIDYSDKYKEETGKADLDESMQYAFANMGEIFDSISVKSGMDITVTLTKKDGKWSIDKSDKYKYEQFISVFAAGEVW